MTRRCGGASRRAFDAQTVAGGYNRTRQYNNGNPASNRNTLWHLSIVVHLLDTPGRFGGGGGGGDSGARCRCSFAIYTTLGGPDGTSTERLTRQWTTPLYSRGRTIPMLTAFHAKCRGSRRLQSVERPWLDSQTRHTYTYTYT